MNRIADLILLVALVLTTVGMAMITFGVVLSGLFFAGVYLLVIGLIGSGIGALLQLAGPRTS